MSNNTVADFAALIIIIMENKIKHRWLTNARFFEKNDAELQKKRSLYKSNIFHEILLNLLP